MDSNEIHRYLLDIFNISKTKEEFGGDYPPIGRIDLPNGGYCYHVGKGCLTGQKGWEEFNYLVRKGLEKELFIDTYTYELIGPEGAEITVSLKADSKESAEAQLHKMINFDVCLMKDLEYD